jgi:dienelactone hydrolase
MVHVVLFHHALGVTPGVRALADRIAAAGHEVHVPDLYDGARFDDLEAGVAHAESLGFLELAERGASAVDGLPRGTVVVGLSLGVMPAQLAAQTRPQVGGAVLCHAAVPLGVLADAWPRGVALVLHGCVDDPLGDVDEARALAAVVPGAELVLHPGAAHLPTDASLPDHDPAIVDAVVASVLALSRETA